MKHSSAISLIGSGNVAFQLATAGKNSGYIISEINSRNTTTGKQLAKKTGARYTNNLSGIKDNYCIILIAVKDDAITEVIKKMPPFKKNLIVHTSGATDLAILKNKFIHCGVLWPVQTISAGVKVDFKKIPLVIEAGSPVAKRQLMQLAKQLSKKVYVLNSQQRKILHLSATIANNFSNHLYYLSNKLLKKHHLPFEILHPLILNTAANGIKNPGAAQTGPAKRNDKKTMKEHLKLLPEKNYRDLYKLISKDITKTYH